MAPRTTNNQEHIDKMAKQVADLWIATGLEEVNYRTVIGHLGVSRGSVQYVFPSVPDMLRAAAIDLIKRRHVVQWGAIECAVDESIDDTQLAVAEAHIWLARHGGHPGYMGGEADGGVDA